MRRPLIGSVDSAGGDIDDRFADLAEIAPLNGGTSDGRTQSENKFIGITFFVQGLGRLKFSRTLTFS